MCAAHCALSDGCCTVIVPNPQCTAERSETHFDEYNEFQDLYKNVLNEDDETVNFPRFENLNIDKFEYFSVDKFNKKFDHKPDCDLQVINLNIRGMNRNYENLSLYLNNFKVKFDIIMLSETHISSDIINKNIHNHYPLEGYDTFYIRSGIKFGGVLMYVKSDLNAAYVHELTGSNTNCDYVYVKLIHNKKSLYIGTYYRHCKAQSTDKVMFIDTLQQHLSSNTLNNVDTIIGGDFNICLMKSTRNTESLMYLNTLLQNQMECHIFKPTRIEYHKNSLQIKSATLIDQISSNLLRFSCQSGNLYYHGSDHFANFLIVEKFLKTEAKKVKTPVFRRNLKNIDLDMLQTDFVNIDWYSKVVVENNIDTCFESIIDETNTLLEKHAPLTEMSRRKAKFRCNAWVDNELLREIRLRDKLFEKKKNSPNDTNKELFRVQKNKVTSVLRNKKRKYFKEYFIKYRQNTSKTWEGINLAMDNTKYKKSLPQVVYDLNGDSINSPLGKAKSFAKYFKDVPNNALKKIKPARFWYMDYFRYKKANNNYLKLYDCNNNEITKHILQLKNRSSPGPISIPNVFLKLIADQISQPLSIAINKSLRAGYFPNLLKLGKQTPVYKTGPCTLNNYRPITVCSSFAKLLEKVVRDRLQNFLLENNILSKYQFGFRKKHSTTHATINLLEATLDGLDNKLKVGGVFLDVSKAFDCVDHDILLKKLEFYGIRDTALMWMESYLKNRKQYVEINGIKSEEYTTDIGVPQGGVLSAILFIIFTNDISESTNKLKFSIFADDTCLIVAVDRSSYDDLLKCEMQKVIDWFSSNKLLLNIDKTEYVFFGPHYPFNYIKGEHDLTELHETGPLYLFQHPDPDYDGPNHTIVNKRGEFCLEELHRMAPKYLLEEHILNDDCTIITANDKVKYLGLFIDTKLHFKHQISIVCCKINRMIGVFWKCLNTINIETKKIIYHSLVESYLNFGIMIWCSELSKNLMSEKDLNHIPDKLIPIRTSQNKILRAIHGKAKKDKKTAEYCTSSPLYKQLNVLKFHDLYYYNLCILAYDYHNAKVFPEAIHEKFSRQPSNHGLRSNNLNLTYSLPNLTNTYKKPSIASTIIWNKIPNKIRELPKSGFKNKLKQFFIEKY